MSLLAEAGGPLDINWWSVGWAWATFFVTLFALSKAAWPLLAEKMERREIRIREGLKKAEEAEKRAQELLGMQETVLAQARQEAQTLLAESRSTAESIKQETLAAAQREIAEERDRAKKEIGLERNKALDELRRSMVDLTLEAAGRVLERSLKDEDHRRLATQVIQEVETLR